MSLSFGIAVFFIVWWLVLFTVLPFGVRTQQEAGEVVPGTPESAPMAPRLRRVFLATTVVASVVFAGIYLMLSNRDVTCNLITKVVAFSLCK